MTRVDEALSGEKGWGGVIVDIFAHIGVGFATAIVTGISGLFSDMGTAATVASQIGAATSLGAAREGVQFGVNKKPHLLDRTVDTAGFTVGGALGAVTTWAIKKFVPGAASRVKTGLVTAATAVGGALGAVTGWISGWF